MEELRKRLIGRATDSMEKIDERVAKAATEMQDASHFDCIIVNDNLDSAKAQLDKEIAAFLG